MKKILIVDSDEQITVVMGLKLRKENFEVKTFSNAQAALNEVGEFLPDLIISEMVLAGLNGVDFLKRVKMNPATIATPFIFLSNSRNVEDKIVAHEMGAEAFFMKPFFIKVLINRIKEFFEERKFSEMIANASENKSFTAELTNISIIDILNIIGENGSSGEVIITAANSDTGKIYFHKGSVVRIESGDSLNKNGIEELYRLLSWIEGSITVNFTDAVSVKGNINISHDKLVAKAVSWFEDYSGELSEMPPIDSPAYINVAKLVNNINRLPDNASKIIKIFGPDGISISSIIEKAELDKRDALKYLKKMMELEIISLEKPDKVFAVPSDPQWLTAITKPAEELKEEPVHKTPEVNDEKVEESLFEEESQPINIYESISPEENKDVGKTLVPPPSFIRRDTLDPAVSEKLDIKPEHDQNERSLNINIEVLQEEDGFDKTEIIRTVDDNSRISLTKNTQTEKEEEKQVNGKRDSARFTKYFLLLLVLGMFAAVYFKYPETLRKFTEDIVYVIEDVSSLIKKEKITEPVELEKENKENSLKNEDKETSPHFSKRQKELLNEPVSDLIKLSAEFFEKEDYLQAIEVNEVVLHIFKAGKITKNSEYESAVTNMAIFYYTYGEFDKALEFAEESLLLRNDAKSIELKAAILEELKKPMAAASLFRTKLNDEKFKEKKDEWMMEINRLENLY